MEEEIVGIDYEHRCKSLAEEINHLKKEQDLKLKINDENWRITVEKQNEEIEWLKKVISGILHI